MMRHRRTIIALTVLACSMVGAGPTTVPSTGPASDAALVLTLEGNGAIKLSADAFAKLPRESVEATDRDGKLATYAGVALWRVLDEIDVPLGPQLRGPEMALFVVAQASDGYRVTFSLAEIDPAFGERHILVTDRCNGEPLKKGDGPLRLVVPQDARQGRWVRMLTSLEVRRAR